MAKSAKKRMSLPKRFNCALSEAAYERLREINAETGLGNNYCLTVLLENLDEVAPPERLNPVFQRFIAEYCPPEEG